CKILYLVQWEGYQGTDEETSWLPAMELDHAQELLVDFHTYYPQKPGPFPTQVQLALLSHTAMKSRKTIYHKI
ncbi:hypothetical protein L208DRAFT_1491392, partial [Tricholoma matsutake]